MRTTTVESASSLYFLKPFSSGPTASVALASSDFDFVEANTFGSSRASRDVGKANLIQ